MLMEILFFSFNFYTVFLKLLKEKEIKAKYVWYSFKKRKRSELIHFAHMIYIKKQLKVAFD